MPDPKARSKAQRPRGAVRGAAAGARRSPRAPGTLLTVDVGNSETTVGRFQGATLDGFWRLTTRPHTVDELEITVKALLAPTGGPRVGGGVLCSVVPALTAAWSVALERLTGTPALVVSAATAQGLVIRYPDPAAIGPDRLANAVAVQALFGTPAIVVDLGTATTFDCISRQGAYLGGIIAPGIGTAAEELFRRAARLSRVELRRPERAVAQSTAEAIRAGVLWGHAGQVDALVRRLALEIPGTPHVIATGGWAPIVAPECETINRVDEALTLRGMRVLWERAR